MSTKPTTTKAELKISTALVPPTAPDAAPPPPPIGDNSGLAGQVLPLPADTHREIEATLDIIAVNEKAIEYARQKLAHLLWNRHNRMVADSAPHTVPFAHDLAANISAQEKYLEALTDEFVVANSPKLKAMTPEQRTAYRKLIKRRLFLALQLFVRLAWHKTNTPDAVIEWNADEGRWHVFPGAFIPPGFTAGGHLLAVKDEATGQDVLRTNVAMESNDSAEWYFIGKAKGSGTTINLSLDQFNYAFGMTLLAMQNPTRDTSEDEATPGRAQRAARQAGTTATPTVTPATDGVAPDVASETSDTPEATAPSGQSDRVWALGQFIRTIVAAEKLLEHDTLSDLSWSDMDKAGTNALRAVEMLIDRMNAKPDGRVVAPGVPAKPAKKMAA